MGRLVEPGDVLLLGGELGAGKTTFTGGVAEALGIQDVVWSPTFTLVRDLQGRLPLAHVDLYRLDTVQEVEELGLDELLDGERVIVVEWGDVVGPLFGPDFLEVRLSHGAGGSEDDRGLVLVGHGLSWVRRWPTLGEELA